MGLTDNGKTSLGDTILLFSVLKDSLQANKEGFNTEASSYYFTTLYLIYTGLEKNGNTVTESIMSCVRETQGAH